MGASSFFLSVSLFAAVAWVGKDALFSDISQVSLVNHVFAVCRPGLMRAIRPFPLQERAQILQAEPIVASHVRMYLWLLLNRTISFCARRFQVSADAASSLADTSVHDQSAVAPTPSENSAPAAAESGGDGDSDGNEGRDYIESISKQMQDKIQARPARALRHFPLRAPCVAGTVGRAV